MSEITPENANGAADQQPGEDFPQAATEPTQYSPMRALARILYAHAHGCRDVTTEELDPAESARISSIESKLNQHVTSAADAMAAWCTLTAIICEMRSRTLRVVTGATPPMHQPRRNPRLLVFQDALEDLAELLDRDLPTHPEAVEWWHNRRSTLLPDADEMRSDLRRLDRLVEQLEADAGMTSDTPDDPAAPKLRSIDKIEGIVHALKDVAERLQQTVIRQQAKDRRN